MTAGYDGQDLLADVFEGTADAPQPVPVRDSNGSVIKLYANPEDPRWSVRMWRWPNGDVRLVHSIEPRQAAETTKITELTPARRQGHSGGPENGSRASTGPASGNGGLA